MDRRTFLSWVGMGWVASSLPVALAACTSSNQSTAQSPATDKQSPASVSPPRADGFVNVGTVAALEKGAIVVPKSAIGPVAVVRYQGALVAVDPSCSHKGCIVDWQPSGEYVCPCHQAKFSPTGGVVGQGPAKTPLKVYQVQIEGSDVLVKATA